MYSVYCLFWILAVVMFIVFYKKEWNAPANQWGGATPFLLLVSGAALFYLLGGHPYGRQFQDKFWTGVDYKIKNLEQAPPDALPIPDDSKIHAHPTDRKFTLDAPPEGQYWVIQKDGVSEFASRDTAGVYVVLVPKETNTIGFYHQSILKPAMVSPVVNKDVSGW